MDASQPRGTVTVAVDVWRRAASTPRLRPHQTSWWVLADGDGDDDPTLVAAQATASQLNSDHHMVAAARVVDARI